MTYDSKEFFFELIQAGLWEKEIRLTQLAAGDFMEACSLAREQSITGLIAAGLEHVVGVKPPQKLTLELAGEVLQIEQRNLAMNSFVVELIKRLRKDNIYAVLVKGQGIGQCYERPLWRTCGDIDLYLSKVNYEKAKDLLLPIAQNVEKEDKGRLHLGMTIDGWVVELHGTMYTKLSSKMNRVADEVHDDIFNNGNVRSWDNNGIQVSLPNANNDVIIVFNHIINHFFLEGVGLRQICDWCRLLYTHKDSLNHELLESRIRRMGLMTEWKAFYNLASKYLGMPDYGSGLMVHDSRYDKKADRIMEFVLESGNFGHNRNVSYRGKKSAVIVNSITLWRRVSDFAKFTALFPVNSPQFFCHYFLNRISNA